MSPGRRREDNADRLDPEELRHIADLAGLELTEAEIERVAAELGVVLGLFARIEALQPPAEAQPSAEAQPPAESAPGDRGLEPRLRLDVVAPDSLSGPLSGVAPDWRNGFFIVPRCQVFDERASRGSEAPEPVRGDE